MKGCESYPKDRYAGGGQESGKVSQGNKPSSKDGSDSYKPSRAGKPASSTGTTNPPKRAGK